MRRLVCQYGSPNGPCGIAAPAEYFDRTETYCLLHQFPIRSAGKPSSEFIQEINAFLTHLGECEGDAPLEIKHVQFYAGTLFPARMRRHLRMVSCLVERVDCLAGLSDLKGLALESIEVHDSLRLSPSVVGAELRLSSCRINGELLIECARINGALQIQACDAAAYKLNDVEADEIVVENTGYQPRLWIETATVRKGILVRGRTYQQLIVSKVSGTDFIAGGLTIIENARLEEVSFTNRVELSKTKVKQTFEFYASDIAGEALLDGTEFETNLIISSMRFQRVFDFRGGLDRTALGNVRVSWTEFCGRAIFSNRRLTGDVDLTGCVFHRAPEFHGCEFHQDIRFPDRAAFRGTAGLAAANAYRTLKQAMESLRFRRLEGMFFALEQRSWRRSEQGGLWDKLVAFAYEKVSDYGQNYLRPALLLLATCVAFGLLYASLKAPIVLFGAPDWTTIGKELAFSVEQTVNPFGIWRKRALGYGVAEEAMQVIASFQSLLSLALFALFLLALRWRFKRD